MTSGRVTEWIVDKGTKQQRIRHNGHGYCVHGLTISFYEKRPRTGKKRKRLIISNKCERCDKAWKRHNYPSRQKRLTR